jgi:hypothetical protein
VIDPLRVEPLKGRRCAECGSGSLTAPQPGVDARFVTAACRNCRNRVATYEACPEAAGYIGQGHFREPIACLLPKGHAGEHSPKFVPLAPKTRGPNRGVKQGKGGEQSKLPASYSGSFTELMPGFGVKKP